MNKEYKNKIIKILKDNSKWPLLIQGVNASNFNSAIVLPAIVHTSQLGVIATDNGLKYPDWALELKQKCQKNNRAVLCIDKIDEIKIDEQEKFYGILKYKAINGFKFPLGTQIIVTATDLNKVNKRLVDLMLVVRSDI